jgi:hypothetical protein
MEQAHGVRKPGRRPRFLLSALCSATARRFPGSAATDPQQQEYSEYSTGIRRVFQNIPTESFRPRTRSDADHRARRCLERDPQGKPGVERPSTGPWAAPREALNFIRRGVGPLPVTEKNLVGLLSALVEIRFLRNTGRTEFPAVRRPPLRPCPCLRVRPPRVLAPARTAPLLPTAGPRSSTAVGTSSASPATTRPRASTTTGRSSNPSPGRPPGWRPSEASTGRPRPTS